MWTHAPVFILNTHTPFFFLNIPNGQYSKTFTLKIRKGSNIRGSPQTIYKSSVLISLIIRVGIISKSKQNEDRGRRKKNFFWRGFEFLALKVEDDFFFSIMHAVCEICCLWICIKRKGRWSVECFYCYVNKLFIRDAVITPLSIRGKKRRKKKRNKLFT